MQPRLGSSASCVDPGDRPGSPAPTPRPAWEECPPERMRGRPGALAGIHAAIPQRVPADQGAAGRRPGRARGRPAVCARGVRLEAAVARAASVSRRRRGAARRLAHAGPAVAAHATPPTVVILCRSLQRRFLLSFPPPGPPYISPSLCYVPSLLPSCSFPFPLALYRG